MTDAPHRAGRSSPWLVTGLLVALAVLPSLPGVTSYFVGDDFDFLLRMTRIDGPLDTLRMSFWGEWEPLWYLGFYRDWKLWGPNPAGFHAANLFWLALGVVALYRLVEQAWPASRVAPWAAALLFATHPLHDEAVTYLAARGHPAATALSLVAVWAWLRSRRAVGAARPALLAGALVAALLAALAKETALMLAGWVFLLEWAAGQGLRLRPRELWRAGRAGLLFALPATAYLALRHAAVGLGSHKLRGPDDGLAELLENVVRHVPDYALAGGLPLPFAFLDGHWLAALRPLGWVATLAAVLPAAWLAARALWRDGRVSPATGLYLWGLGIALVSLLPLFWADLGLRRRYFFTSSVGWAVSLAVLFHWLSVHRRRLAWALLVVLTAAGALGLVQRNLLYLRAGRVTRAFVETVGGAPLDRHAGQRRGTRRRIALLTLPRYLGGDGFSGAYLLHRTDAISALRLAGAEQVKFGSGLKCHFAEDYTADAVFDGPVLLGLTASFQTRRAYAAALRRDDADDREGNLLAVAREAGDDRTRQLRYKVLLPRSFFADPASELYLYSDERFRRLVPPG